MPAPIQPSTTNRSVFPTIRILVSQGVGLQGVREEIERRFPTYLTRGAKLAFHIDQVAIEFWFHQGKTDQEILSAFQNASTGSERAALWTIGKIHSKRTAYNTYRRAHNLTWNLDRNIEINIAPEIVESVAVAPEMHERETPFDLTRTYGIEIEFLYPSNINVSDIAEKLTQAGVETYVEPYNHATRGHWKIVTDASVEARDVPNYCGGHELVSPILKGKRGLLAIEKACKVLQTLKINVNRTTGLHVHMGINGNNKYKVVRNVIGIYQNYKKEFNSILPDSRRNNHHCKWFDTDTMAYFQTDKTLYNFRNEMNRYHVVNVNAVQRHGTCEFRQAAGTTDNTKIENWIRILNRIMDKAESKEDIFNYNLKGFYAELGIIGSLKKWFKKRAEWFALTSEERRIKIAEKNAKGKVTEAV